MLGNSCSFPVAAEEKAFTVELVLSEGFHSHTELLGLAPTNLLNYRSCRYLGDDLCLPLASLAIEDRHCARALYDGISELLALFADRGEKLPADGFRSFLSRYGHDGLLQIAGQLGRVSYRESPSALLGKVLHDIRGGGLTPLLCLLQLAERYGQTAVKSETLFFMARDHLKIMRNALLGLDDVKRQLDFLPRVHTSDLLAAKWTDALLEQDGRPVRVKMSCSKSAPISECCVEFGALDRILYNLLNNAARHTATDIVELAFLPVPDEQGQNGRFVVLNSLRPKDLEYLRSRQLSTLFLEGESTTGSGFGLAIAADFVSRAFGLSNPWAAVQGGYLGAALLAEQLAVWLHWPLVGDRSVEKR